MGLPSSASTIRMVMISMGFIPLSFLISLILNAVGSVSSLTTIASIELSVIVVPMDHSVPVSRSSDASFLEDFLSWKS